ncbi:uncharacterized protein CMU_024880 [Cryptosporidium muris RN66]|uniref:Uncharacterized protein n=1 Tax=Cryptosporidium muris (strain RN66) TaxID=441375 RepID=B6AAT0_CRYMR|nr:uncharacterized protein CMU_024880 [Cryptosporidium muris RN66]EEA05482.1 hypothetical protein, conserved [Cryptosporidium muris RN66]|eukprot:XP_002139831.1 hypothetical protein [Cryptosporidium muris RN66]
MSLRGLVIGPTQMLVESVLRRINENLLDYFINLPESIWLSGFLDQVHLKDVMFNTRAFSNEWYSLDIPFRLKYGHIGRANIQVLFAHSKLIVEVENMVIIVGPNLAYKSYTDVIQSTIDKVASHIEQFRQIQTMRRNKDDNEDTSSSDESKETLNYKNSEVKHIPNDIEESNTTNKEGLNTLLRWLFRYVPDLSFTIRNLYIRYEDDILDSSHPVAGGVHINSVVINPARSCWDLEWPSDTNDNVMFVSHSSDFSNKSNKTINSSNNVNSSDSPQIDASSTPQCNSKDKSSSNIDPRGIFNLKIRTCGVFWDDDSAPFIPMSLLEETEASDIKYGVFSAITTDDMQNIVNKNLSYHTWVISNLNISSQFGFVDPKNIKSPDNLKDIELNTKSKLDHLSQSSFYNSSKSHIMDNYSLPNMITILNVNIHNGLIINIYPHLVHGIVRLLTSCNQFYTWTQVRRFRPIKRPTNGVNADDTRKICCEWWRFILRYYRYVRKEESGFNNLKDEINYRIERKRYIKIIKRWKWIELIVNGTKPISDSGRITSISSFNLESGDVVMPNNTGNNIKNTFVQFSNGTSSEICLCEYWRYELKVLQLLAIRSEDINFILTVLQHQPYWTIAQWHILAEREFEVEFALSQNNNIQNTPNSKKRSKSISDNLTLVAFGLHTQKDTILWDLVDQLKYSLSKCILETSEFHSNINHNIKSSKFSGSFTTNAPINSSSYPGIAELNIFLLQNKEYHPYILYGENILPFETNDILIDFFGSNSQKFANNDEICKKHEDSNIYQINYKTNSSYCKKTLWHPIRLRLHLWGRFYDEYFDAFPLSLSQTMEFKQLIQFSHFLDFQQINAIAFVEYDSTFTLSASSSFDLVSLAAVASTSSDTFRTRNKLVITPAKHKVLNTNMNSSLDNMLHDHKFENYLINEDENFRPFEFEKQLTEFYKESLNFPESLNKMAEEGFQLPKILQNRLISICIPKFEINLCHLVQDNINGKNLLLDTQAQDTNKYPGILSSFLAQSRSSLSNSTQLIISFTPRKLFGIVFNSLAFKINTFNTVRINCYLRKVDLVTWNHSDSHIFTSLVEYMSKEGNLAEKMVNENSISLISIGLDKVSNLTENLEYSTKNKSVLDEKNINNIDSETLISADSRKLKNCELSEQNDKFEISGNSQLKDLEESTNVNDALSPTFQPLVSTPIRKVKFEEPSSSAQSKYCDSNNLTPHETIKTNYSKTISKKVRKWNYFNLVMLPPASKVDQKILSSSRSNTTFSLRLPFYLKVDLQIMDMSIVFNDELLDCLRAEILKLLQVYSCTQWSQYKGFGTFPISKKGKQATQSSGQDGNLILCPPFRLISNLSLQGENFEWQIQRWSYLDQLLNKIHIRISIKLPRIDLVMLNNVNISSSTLLIELVPSFHLTIEPQIILLGTILDKFDKKYNRLYFRGSQVKFDTLQSLSNVIQLYTRIKNIIISRYNDIIQLFEVFNYEKFENIPRHSLAYFTKEVLKLQSQPLLDTNEIPLKEFSLSVEADYINQSSPSLNITNIEEFSYSTTNINDDKQQYNDCTEEAKQSQVNIDNSNNTGEHLKNNQTIEKSSEISSNIEKSERNDFPVLNVSNLSDTKFSSIGKDLIWDNNTNNTTKMTTSISYDDSKANNLDLTLNTQPINIEKFNVYNKDNLSCIVRPVDMHPDLDSSLAFQKYQVNPEVRIAETYSSKKLSNSILKGGIQSISATCALSPKSDLTHYPGFNEKNTFNTTKSDINMLPNVKNYNLGIKTYKQLNTDVSELSTSKNSLPLIPESVLINSNTQGNTKYNTKTFHGTINSNFQSSANNSRNLVNSTVFSNTAYQRYSTNTTVKGYLLKSNTTINPRKSHITLRTGLNIEKPKQ